MHGLRSIRARRSRPAHRLAPSLLLVALHLLLAAPALGGEVWLTSGDRLTGTIVEVDSTRVVLEHEILGRLEIPFDQIASMTTGDDGAPQPPPPDAASPPPAPTPAPEPTEPPVPEPEEPDLSWKSHFEFGAAGAWGNTDSQNFFLRLGTERLRPEVDHTRFNAIYLWSSSDGDRDTNRFNAEILQDWLVPDSRWLYFANGTFDFDEFQSWEYRLTGHGGVGYKLVERDDFTFTLRGGLGGNKEWHSPDSDLRAEVLAGAELTWQATERQSIRASSFVYPDLSNTGEFRVVNRAGWDLLLDEELNMSLALGFRHEHQSDAAPGFERDDYNLTAGLKIDF